MREEGCVGHAERSDVLGNALLAAENEMGWNHKNKPSIRTLPTHLREVHEHLRHLIAALAAAHVDDAITVGVLGQGLRG